ncbi:hypothetical protein F4604DRAFT_1916044 [Suillus subluteus]|nr:hypothetical protein F4604DRAFT_1916044 [Suillus subluteus]
MPRRSKQRTWLRRVGPDDAEMPEFETEEGGNNDAEMKTEDMEVGVGEVKVEDEDLAIDEDYYQPVVASPCKLLTRHVGNPNEDPENPTVPWSYYIKKSISQDPDASL